MAIDFLGKPKPVKKKIGPEVKYHVPEKEKAPKTEATKKEAPAPAVKKVEAPKPQELSEADLITAFKKKMRRKKLIIACLIILICLGGIIGGYFLYNYIINLPPPPPPPVVKYLCNSTTGQCSLDESGTYDSLSACQASCFAPPPIPVCGNGICETNENSENCASDCPASVVVKYSCNTTSGQCFADANGTYTTLSACQASCFAPLPIPVCGNGICETNETSENCPNDCPPVILPDTELAPLRGALAQFGGDSNIFLIENNGELRKIDKQTVIFKNGQNIYQLNQNLIYSLSSQFANTRKGKDVKGFIDWDPRILTEQELAPYIK